jgi:hypothetical protein
MKPSPNDFAHHETIAALFLLAGCQFCFASGDTNIAERLVETCGTSDGHLRARMIRTGAWCGLRWSVAGDVVLPGVSGHLRGYRFTDSVLLTRPVVCDV